MDGLSRDSEGGYAAAAEVTPSRGDSAVNERSLPAAHPGYCQTGWCRIPMLVAPAHNPVTDSAYPHPKTCSVTEQNNTHHYRSQKNNNRCPHHIQ